MKTYHGSCHCGAVRFEADGDVSAGTNKCNCTYCRKVRLWSLETTEAQFRLLAGSDVLRDYQGGNAVAHHFFCSICGLHPFDRIDMPNMTGHVYYNVSLACLDDVQPHEIIEAPVRYFDGLNDRWGERPADVLHL